jgi:hypothetical protein
MLRNREFKNVWRLAILALLFVALLGPWWFDLIFVPAEYACTTAIRLDDKFCGIPMAGIGILFMMISLPLEGVVRLATGAITPGDLFNENFIRGLLVVLLLLSLVLPFFSTVFLIRKKGSPRRRVFHRIGWGLAAAAGLWFGLSNHPELFWVLWGVWLYIGVAVCALILELLIPDKNMTLTAN